MTCYFCIKNVPHPPYIIWHIIAVLTLNFPIKMSSLGYGKYSFAQAYFPFTKRVFTNIMFQPLFTNKQIYYYFIPIYKYYKNSAGLSVSKRNRVNQQKKDCNLSIVIISTVKKLKKKNREK